MREKKSPRLMLITSMAIFGTLGLFVRNIPVSSGKLALYRAVIISVTILGEKMTLWQVIGGILILGFTLWNEMTPAKVEETA